MFIYCVVSDVKHESLVNAKVRRPISTQQQYMYPVCRPLAKKFTANQRKEHNVDLKSTFTG